MEYYLRGNKVQEEYAFWRFKQYQRSLGTLEEAIPIMWEACHHSIDARINDLPDNLEMTNS